MGLKTKLLELFKYEPDKDGAQTFNIKSALNDNWDKIEAWAQSVKTALTKLVPTSRKVNGKTLTKDVTLTAADIKMPDSEEDVGAAMAKRDVEYGVIAPENLQEWASAQTAGGTFMLTPRTAKGVPYPLYWRGLLTGDFPGNDRALLIFTDDVMHRACTGSGKWGGPWRKVADCIAPETHQLPLADGWTKFDATCRYYKTQESIVIVSIAARTTQSFRVSAALATLPEGFRPAADLEVPAIFKGSRRLVTIKATSDGNLFVDLTDQPGVAITSDDYFFATFAFMS